MFGKILTTVFILIIMVTVFIAVVVKAGVVTDGLVSYWTLDKNDIKGEIVKDVWGKNDGEFRGNPKMVEGKIGEALKFNGSSDYVMIKKDQSLNITDAITVEAWVNLDSVSGAKQIATMWTSSAGYQPWFENSTFMLRLNNGTGNFDAKYSGLSAKVWYHVAGTWDGNTIRAYVNGKEGVPVGMNGKINIPDTNLNIGSYNNGAGEFFGGVIDEVRIYNRALSKDEINQNLIAQGLAIKIAGKLATTWAGIKARQY